MNHMLACYTSCEVASAPLMRKLRYFLLAFRILERFCVLGALFGGLFKTLNPQTPP